MHDTLLVGVREFFLNKPAVTQRIKARLYDLIEPLRLTATESPNLERNPRTMELAEYRIVGDLTPQNMSGESDFKRALIGFRLYAFAPETMRSLFRVFLEALGTSSGQATNRLRGETWNGCEIKAAHWMRETYTEDVDEQLRMCVAECVLAVDYEFA